MGATTDISFKVTSSQKETIESRMLENGFDELSAYLKVVALKTQTFSFTSAGSSAEDVSVELRFKVTEYGHNKGATWGHVSI